MDVQSLVPKVLADIDDFCILPNFAKRWPISKAKESRIISAQLLETKLKLLPQQAKLLKVLVDNELWRQRKTKEEENI